MNFSKILITSYLVFFILYIIAPYDSAYQIETKSILILFLGILSAFIGLLSSEVFRSKLIVNTYQVIDFNESLQLNKVVIRRLIYRINLFGFLGCSLLLIDRFLIRGVSLELSYLETRMVLEDSSTSLYGLLGNFLSAFGVFSLGMMIYSKKILNESDIKRTMICCLVAGLYIFNQVLLGSRSGIMVFFLVTMYMLIWSNILLGKKIFNYKLLGSLILLLIFFSIMWVIFLNRLESMGISALYSINNSAYAHTLLLDKSFYDQIEQEGLISNILIAYTSMLMYLHHGMFEFFLLLDNFNSNHSYGSVSLWLPIKILSTLGLDFSTANLGNMTGVREGVFSTFFGPLYIDFGILMPLFICTLFFFMGYFALKSKRNFLFLPLASILVCTLILLPSLNLLVSASGIYPLISSIVMPVLGKKFSLAQRAPNNG